MLEDLPRFRAAGAGVALVTLGTPQQAGEFFPAPDLEMTVLADPQQAAYRAFGLERATLWQLAGPKVWLPSIKAIVRGHVGKPVGDVRRLPGTFVIDPQGVVRYAHRPADQADRPDHEHVLSVLRSLSAASGG